MVGNAGIDVLTGSVPLAGDLFDAAFQANRRNLELLERATTAHARGEAAHTRNDYLVVGGAITALIMIMALPLIGVIALLGWAFGSS
jgi:Domain of unknown function (DUF4112)